MLYRTQLNKLNSFIPCKVLWWLKVQCKAQVWLFVKWPLWKIEGEWLVAQCMIMQYRNGLGNLFPPPPHMTRIDVCRTIRPVYLCRLNVRSLPYPFAQRVRKSISGALRFSALNWIHACMCVHYEWERMVGRPEHPVCLSRTEYTHHCGMRTLFIAYNGRLSYSHVIWRKKDNLSFCSSILLKTVKDEIWFMCSPWDTRCAFGDKQEQVHPSLGFC